MKTKSVIALESTFLIFGIIILLGIILFGKSFHPTPRISVSESISERQPEPTGDFNSVFFAEYVSNNKTLENEISNETVIPCYRENELLFETYGCFVPSKDADRDYTHNAQMDIFQRMITMYPDPLVRVTDGYYYLVYQTDHDTRLFLFYSTIDHQGMFLTGYPIIMKETLSHKDFSKIKVGDSIEKVRNIDSIIPLYHEIFEKRPAVIYESDKEQGVYFTSMHLLSDGIMRIDYDRKDGDYVIIDVTYNKNFILEGEYRETCYKIFEQDYIE